jgi:uncharacterized membrane protein YfcA
MVPHVSAATSAFMIVFTSSATTVQYLILGRLPYDYALTCFIAGFLGAVVGHIGVAYMVRKYKKQSLVSFMLATVIGFSGLLMVGLLIYQIVQGDQSMSFSSICSNVIG